MKKPSLIAVTLWLLFAILSGCGSDDGADSLPQGDYDSSETDEESPYNVSYDFTVVALPDTQSYSAKYPEVFVDQIQWIVDHAEEQKIAFVTHLGDVVNNESAEQQWLNARDAMDRLDGAGIPYGVVLGNHDAVYYDGNIHINTAEGCSDDPEEPCDAMRYIDNFGPQRYQQHSWYGGTSPTALSNFETFSYDGQEFLFLHLPIDPWDEEIDWAEQVIADHPDAAVALSTHRYLLDWRMTEEMGYPFDLLAAGRVDSFITSFIQKPYFENGWNAEELFNKFISKQKQIYMVQCGHFDAEYYQVSTNEHGLPVHEMLVDFQSLPPQGGNGYMRLLRYDVTNGRIHVQTYSPTLDRFRENGEGFDFSVELVQNYFQDNREYIEAVADIDEVETQIEYWTETPAGKEEFRKILQDSGQRESHFSFEVDFGSYRQNL